jgi:hypothetical protein
VHFPYREYHSAAETPDLVDSRRLEDTVELALQVARSQLETPVPPCRPQNVRQRLVPP